MLELQDKLLQLGIRADCLLESNMLGVWQSGGRHSWVNEAFDTKLREASGFLGDPNERLNLFKEAERSGIANGNLTGTKGKRVAQLTIKEADARTFGIQLYNYSSGQSVRYLINVQGL